MIGQSLSVWDIDLVNSSTGATILTYAINNIAANGGTGSDTESLVNITLTKQYRL